MFGPVGKLVAFAGKVVVLVQIQKLVALIKKMLYNLANVWRYFQNEIDKQIINIKKLKGN